MMSLLFLRQSPKMRWMTISCHTILATVALGPYLKPKERSTMIGILPKTLKSRSAKRRGMRNNSLAQQLHRIALEVQGLGAEEVGVAEASLREGKCDWHFSDHLMMHILSCIVFSITGVLATHIHQLSQQTMVYDHTEYPAVEETGDLKS
jgi:hypothetical protein